MGDVLVVVVAMTRKPSFYVNAYAYPCAVPGFTLRILARMAFSIAVNGPRWIAAEVAYRMGRRWM